MVNPFLAAKRPVYEDSTCALLRQGSRDGWTAASYARIADYFDRRDPYACLYWEREARRCF
jgi:hypothetical protein